MRNRTTTLITLVLALVLVGCSSPNAAPPAAPQVSVEGAWTRTTTGAKDPTMTAVFLTIVNPGSADVRLVGADCARAGVVQIHDMVTVDGRLVMQQVEGGVVVPSGSHLHQMCIRDRCTSARTTSSGARWDCSCCGSWWRGSSRSAA